MGESASVKERLPNLKVSQATDFSGDPLAFVPMGGTVVMTRRRCMIVSFRDACCATFLSRMSRQSDSGEFGDRPLQKLQMLDDATTMPTFDPE